MSTVSHTQSQEQNAAHNAGELFELLRSTKYQVLIFQDRSVALVLTFQDVSRSLPLFLESLDISRLLPLVLIFQDPYPWF